MSLLMTTCHATQCINPINLKQTITLGLLLGVATLVCQCSENNLKYENTVKRDGYINNTI